MYFGKHVNNVGHIFFIDCFKYACQKAINTLNQEMIGFFEIIYLFDTAWRKLLEIITRKVLSTLRIQAVFRALI